jgi:hypothetical protein
MPRAYKRINNTNTGYAYYRRTRTDEAQTLTVSGFKRMLPKAYEEGFETRTFYLNDYKHDFLAFIPIQLEPPGIPIRFEVTKQHKGQRVWFVCPHCYRRVGKLYRIWAPHQLFRIWGCQPCLGLTYPSQAGHKTLARDGEIANGFIEASYSETIRACGRYRRRLAKVGASIDRMMKQRGLR